MSRVTLFDPARSPLEGVNLIEASAGTGKTYAITALFLRLLLEKGMAVKEILVVTFTEAATAELKDRIRRRLREAEMWLEGEREGDLFLEALFSVDFDRRETLRRLRLAITGFDEAAIFTIHGFCGRVLREQAFESGALFDTELQPDLSSLRREVVEDFWRRHFYDADPLFVQYALGNGVTPDAFVELARNRVAHPDLRIIPDFGDDVEDFTERVRTFEGLAEQVSERWGHVKETIPGALLEGDSLKRNVYKPESVAGWCAELETDLQEGPSGLLSSEAVRRFSTEAIQCALKKDKERPQHPFFDLCEDLVQARHSLNGVFDRALLRLKRLFFEEFPRGLEDRKRERNIQSFDDLLLKLYAALRSGTGGHLVRSVRTRFKAALIDEFQDTDPVQYDIFQTFFGCEDAVLFLIGDPKQAIYSFRGADVFAYMKASGEAQRRYTLGENWRSEPPLVAAVNHIFQCSPDPFVYGEIPFQPVAPAPGKEHEYFRLEGVAADGSAPFELWFMEPEGDALPTKGEARERVHGAVAAGIVRLMSAGRNGRAWLGQRPLQERDIAVLVRRNAEARRLQEVLLKAGVSSVLYSTGNLFDTTEALEMERILTACLEPQNDRALRAALATRAMGLSGEDLFALGQDERAWEGTLGRFRTLNEIWQQNGFLPMFRHLLHQDGALQRLAPLVDGERRSTNFLHLAEVVHKAASEGRLTMDGTIKWLREQRDPSAPRLDEHQLRLESDRDAVTILTVHRAKGLEWPVVFCPFLWDRPGGRARNSPVMFHDPEARNRLTIDLGSPELEENRVLAEREALAEGCRLLYVALTRAKNHCVFVWGRFKDGERSAPARVLHGGELLGGGGDADDRGGGAGAGMQGDLLALVRRASGAIHLKSLPEWHGEALPQRKDEEVEWTTRRFRGRLERQWSLTSFSSLSAIADGPEPTVRDVDDVLGGEQEDGVSGGGAAAGLDDASVFPRGARAGTCLHDVMEHLDFAGKKMELEGLVAETLPRYGFGVEWTSTVAGMVRRVLDVPLEEDPPLRLSQVGKTERLNELGFYFPLKRLSPEGLCAVFQRHAVRLPSGVVPENLGRLTFAPVKGFMRGFIDLVFRQGSRYYIVDWKSNDLGPAVEDYAAEPLLRAMEKSLYILQYHIYTLALHRYLSLRIPAYRYEEHFGGVYYVFMRGVDPVRGGVYGIFRDRPCVELIFDLERNLMTDGG